MSEQCSTCLHITQLYNETGESMQGVRVRTRTAQAGHVVEVERAAAVRRATRRQRLAHARVAVRTRVRVDWVEGDDEGRMLARRRTSAEREQQTTTDAARANDWRVSSHLRLPPAARRCY